MDSMSNTDNGQMKLGEPIVVNLNRIPIKGKLEIHPPHSMPREVAEEAVAEILTRKLKGAIKHGHLTNVEHLTNEIESKLEEEQLEYLGECEECGSNNVLNENSGDIFCPFCRI